MAISGTTGDALPGGSILGTRVLRTEDPGFLTTGAVYTDDLVDERLAGAVHATFVRSPVAHGRITSIDTSGAAGMPGVVAVLTAGDLEQIDDERVHLLESPALAISSTECRRRAGADAPVWYLVPDGVVQYINKYGLYQPEDDAHPAFAIDPQAQGAP